MKIKELIEIALKEDLGKLKDITSRAVFTEQDSSKATIIAKAPGIVAGIKVVKEVFHKVDPTLEIHCLVEEGDKVEPSSKLLIIEGSTISILEGERVALNFLGHLSGIATTVQKYVATVNGTGVQILDTRKTLPGLRILEKHAVIVGGGVNHRMGLYDMILIKDNHIEAAGGISNAVERVRREYGEDFFIEVEASTIKEVEEAIRNRVDRILLDNMSVEQLKQSVELVNGEIPLEASGNVNLDTVRPIAETGVQFISIGSITLSSQSLDVSLLF